MDITCISDLHGNYPELEGGDLLIVAGDLTERDTDEDLIIFFKWIAKIYDKYKKIIFIGGNHDNLLEKIHIDDSPKYNLFYLQDESIEFEGLKIWGSPWTKTFLNMNPHCKAFTVDTEEELASKFSLIPDDVDILVTHSPPWGILDSIDKNKLTYHLGSTSLRKIAYNGYKKTNLKLHVFGHIHEQGGKQTEYMHLDQFTICVNASHVDEVFDPINNPVRVVL
jgi:Icc-related predicted phosphoesterase